VSTSGQVTLGPTEVVARIAKRTYSPVLRSADLPEVEVPGWGGRRLLRDRGRQDQDQVGLNSLFEN
jgi:hypothetical protein